MGNFALISIVMETKDRIRMIMESQHMTQQVFADFLQQSPATLSSIFNGRTRPTLNVVDAIKAKIPDISIEWLLYGSGDMYVSHSTDSSAADEASPTVESEPMLQFDAPSPVSHQNAVQAPPYQSGMRNVRYDNPPEVRIVEHEPRKVTEIRVYYDDQTYETFVPAKK
jgi:transcriptional regulator with XRE-family HTH domain